MNFTADGKDLKLKNFAGNVEYLILMQIDEAAFEVVDSIQAEEGDGYAGSIAALCEKYGITTEKFGITTEEFDKYMEKKDSYDALNADNFFFDHPECERIEFQGELKTEEEMDEIFLGMWNSY